MSIRKFKECARVGCFHYRAPFDACDQGREYPGGCPRLLEEAKKRSSYPPSLAARHRRWTEKAEAAAAHLELAAALIRAMVEVPPEGLPLQIMNCNSLIGLAMKDTQEFVKELLKDD